MMVAHCSDDSKADVGCPNCGQIEKCEHLCVCPCEDRTILINDHLDKLSTRLFVDGRTEPQIA